MKKLLVILLFVSLQGFATKYYLSPTGSDSNTGAIGSPWFTLNKAMDFVDPGDTVYLRGGTFQFNNRQDVDVNGTSGSRINIWEYPGERAILSRSATYYTSGATIGIYISANYLYFKDFEVTGFNQTSGLASNQVAGLWVTNSSYCIFEGLSSYLNGTGLVMKNNSGHNIIRYCDFWGNNDPFTSPTYDNADGCQVAFLTGAAMSDTTWIQYCRSYWNSDDGFDCYDNDGVVIYEGNWSFCNGFIPFTATPAGSGNGNGFKLGKTTTGYASLIKRYLYFNVAAMNRDDGYDMNQARCRFVMYNNTAYLNGNVENPLLPKGIGFKLTDDALSENFNHILKNNLSYGNLLLSGGATAGSTLSNNTFLYDGTSNSSYTVNSADFLSLDTTGITGSRIEYTLPNIHFLRLKDGSDLIDTGTNVGLPYNYTAPDVGAFEYLILQTRSALLRRANKTIKYNGKEVKTTLIID